MYLKLLVPKAMRAPSHVTSWYHFWVFLEKEILDTSWFGCHPIASVESPFKWLPGQVSGVQTFHAIEMHMPAWGTFPFSILSASFVEEMYCRKVVFWFVVGLLWRRFSFTIQGFQKSLIFSQIIPWVMKLHKLSPYIIAKVHDPVCI